MNHRFPVWPGPFNATCGVAFTGRTAGQYEVWGWPSMIGKGQPYEFSKTFVFAYNNRMRLMVEYPEHFGADYEHLSAASVTPAAHARR